MKTCIIIPAFNEEDNIATVIEGIKMKSDADVIVIDDGSKDLTAATSEKAGALVIRHPFNMGYGTALQTAYKYAAGKRYDYVLQMDGDGQHDPSYIPVFFEKIQSLNCDVLIGSRFLGHGDFKAGVLKSMAIAFFRLIIRMITRKKITDPTSGYQCLHKDVFTFFTEDSFPCDYPDANIIILLHRKGFIVNEIPVAMVANPTGRSMHQGFFTILYYFFKIFLSIFIVMIREKKTPLRKAGNP